MQIRDYINDKKYADELLKYIHSEVGLINLSKKEIISLIKEHKRAVKDFGIERPTKVFYSRIWVLDDKTSETKI